MSRLGAGQKSRLSVFPRDKYGVPGTPGQVEVSHNEWGRACNLRDRYWLYVVFDCATPNPRLVRVQDPFGNVLAKAKESVLISAKQVMDAREV